MHILLCYYELLYKNNIIQRMAYPEFPIPSIVMWFDASAEDLKPENVQSRVYDPRHDLFFFHIERFAT